MQHMSLNSMYDWLSYDIVRFKIEVGVEEKCTYKNVALNTREMAIVAVAATSLRHHHHELDLSAQSINRL